LLQLEPKMRIELTTYALRVPLIETPGHKEVHISFKTI